MLSLSPPLPQLNPHWLSVGDTPDMRAQQRPHKYRNRPDQRHSLIIRRSRLRATGSVSTLHRSTYRSKASRPPPQHPELWLQPQLEPTIYPPYSQLILTVKGVENSAYGRPSAKPHFDDGQAHFSEAHQEALRLSAVTYPFRATLPLIHLSA